MNKEEVKQLKENIKSLEGQNVLITIDGAIQYHTIINQAKIIASDERLVMSDQHQQDIIIDLMYLEEIEVSENRIEMIMSNAIEISLQG